MVVPARSNSPVLAVTTSQHAVLSVYRTRTVLIRRYPRAWHGKSIGLRPTPYVPYSRVFRLVTLTETMSTPWYF